MAQQQQKLKYNNYLQVPDNNNKKQQQQHQKQIQKKHSGPLDAALNELRRQEEKDGKEEEEAVSKFKAKVEEEEEEPKQVIKSSQRPKHAHTHTHTHTHTHIHGHGHGQRKRERWLLTRKTWKFMQDAGRKLLPDNVQNRKEDIPIIEAHFQEICGNENKFLLWRRKVSFPGARRTSLRSRNRRLPCIRRHQQQQQSQRNVSVEQTADQTMELLAKYLNLDDHATTTTALLSSKTQQPHQTVSPSSQRPLQQHIMLSQEQQQQQFKIDENLQLTQLLTQLRALSNQLSELNLTTTATANTNSNWLPKPESITHDLLENKTLLRQIYNALKRQQLHRQLSRHTTPTILLRRTLSFNNLYPCKNMSKTTPVLERKQPPTDLQLKSTTTTQHNRNNTQQQDTIVLSMLNNNNKHLCI